VNFLTLDFETFFSDTYTLKKMTTEAYIRDDQFEAHMVAYDYTVGAHNYSGYHNQETLSHFFSQVDWANTACLCHHAQFDGLILSHHYGVKSAAWLDTMSMARFVFGGTMSASLGSLAKHFGLPEKNVPYDLFKNRRWENIPDEIRQEMGAGAMHDVALTRAIFDKLRPLVPDDELFMIDQTIRMFTEPALVGDVDYLAQYQHDEWSRKNELLLELGVSAADLQSADKFCAILEEEGIEVEYKAGKNGEIPALAKTDEFMKGLLEHDNPIVADLAQARLDVKSTIDETRAGRLVGMARRGPLCVYLTHAGADTKRDSGGDKLNWQNFPRVRLRDDGTEEPQLKAGICAPPGYLIADPDLSQIECRLLNAVAGQDDVLQMFRDKVDIYSVLASKFYGFEITKADKPRRGVGKQLELSCGYGAGTETIIATAKRGTYGPPVELSFEEGLRARDTYRTTHQAICAPNTGYWAQANKMIAALAGTDKPIEWGPLVVETGVLRLPDGLNLLYPDLQFEDGAGFNGSKGWRYRKRKGRAKLYGGKLVQNIMEGLARAVVFAAAVRIKRAAPQLKLCNREHDKLVFLVPADQYAEQTNRWLLEQMCVPPSWLPHVPLAAEGELSERYG
jgi:DNA polymerase